MEGNFTITTGKGKYNCSKLTIQNSEMKKDVGWEVNVEFNNGVKGNFTLPYDWARTRVFQFIDSIDKEVA